MIFEYNEDYQSQLKFAWLKFINNEKFDYSFMRPGIFDSWQVSRYYQVDPYNLEVNRLSSSEIDKILVRHSELIEIAKPEIEKLYSIIKGSNVYIVLTNNEGIVLYSIGDRKNIVLSGPHTRLIVGSSWNISEAGTSSIASCIATKKPVQIYGCEHFKSHYQTHTCSGAPIFDINDNMIGTINISAFRDEVTIHTLGMIVHVAKSIERSLKLKTVASELAKLHNTTYLTKGSGATFGIILLNNENCIVHINSQALKMLDLKIEEALGHYIFSLAKIEINNKADQSTLFRLKNSIYDIVSDITLVRTQTTIKKSLSLHKLDDINGANFINVLTLSDPICEASAHGVPIAQQIDTSNFTARYKFDFLVGSSPSLLKAISESKNAAKHNSNILITGESGTGKEIFAHAIHNASSRCKYPFIAINCGAIPLSLAESELFGYSKGAFTGGLKDGAPGKFELANGGTIFLDEIGELPLSIQVSLLRVLESREVVRISGNKAIKLDIRIIAATNKDLYQAMLEKAFREDLYYRLNVMPIYIPPLRERGNDIILLANHFIQKCNAAGDNIILDDDVYEVLLNYTWPGNIRELSNVIEHAMSVREGNRITLEDLSLPWQLRNPASYHDVNEKKNSPLVTDEDLSILNYEANVIISALKHNKGHVTASSIQLGLNSRTLYRKLKKLDINPKLYR